MVFPHRRDFEDRYAHERAVGTVPFQKPLRSQNPFDAPDEGVLVSGEGEEFVFGVRGAVEDGALAFLERHSLQPGGDEFLLEECPLDRGVGVPGGYLGCAERVVCHREEAEGVVRETRCRMPPCPTLILLSVCPSSAHLRSMRRLFSTIEAINSGGGKGL